MNSRNNCTSCWTSLNITRNLVMLTSLLFHSAYITVANQIKSTVDLVRLLQLQLYFTCKIPHPKWTKKLLSLKHKVGAPLEAQRPVNESSEMTLYNYDHQVCLGGLLNPAKGPGSTVGLLWGLSRSSIPDDNAFCRILHKIEHFFRYWKTFFYQKFKTICRNSWKTAICYFNSHSHLNFCLIYITTVVTSNVI